MHRAERSLLVFGIYLLILGPSLAIAPNLVLRVLGIPETRQVWIRILGVLVTNIGIYYLVAARRGLRPIVVASVPVRLGLMTMVALFVVFANADPLVLLFGVADVVGAAWTAWELRSERSARSVG